MGLRVPATDVAVRDYQELTIRLASETGGNVSVTLEPPDSEPVTGQFSLQVTPRDVSRAIASTARLYEKYIARNLQSDTLDPLKDIGIRLFSSLFEGRRRAIYERCLSRARDTGEGVRLRIYTQAGNVSLDWVPWEFIYDPLRSDFVGLSMLSPVLRQGTATLRQPPSPIPLPVRVLVVGAEVAQLGVASTLQLLRGMGEEFRDFVDLEFINDATPDQFLGALNTHKYNVIHFVGTGVPTRDDEPSDSAESTGLILMPPDGSPPGEPFKSTQVVGSSVLAEALAGQLGPHLVMLDACYSQAIAVRLAEVVPAVIGYRGSYSVRACETFVAAFYRSLLIGEPIERAMTAARQAIDRTFPGSREWGQIVLYLQTPEWAIVPAEQASPSSDSASLIASVGESEKDRGVRLRLGLLETNLRALEEQRSRMAPYDVPKYLAMQIGEVEDKIRAIRQGLGE